MTEEVASPLKAAASLFCLVAERACVLVICLSAVTSVALARVLPDLLLYRVEVERESAGQHRVSWKHPFSDEHQLALYRQYNGGTWTKVAKVSPNSSRLESVSKSGDYTYRIHKCLWDGTSMDDCAGNPFGGSATVNVLYIGTPGGLVLPSTDDDGLFDVSWSQAPGDRPATYELQERKDSGSWRLARRVADSSVNPDGSISVSFSDKDNATWYYRARACNSRGNCSTSYTATKSIKVSRPPGIPDPDPLEKCMTGATKLSPIAKSVLDRIQTTESLKNSPVPQNLLVSYCNRLSSVLVDGPDIFKEFKSVISKARYEVNIAFFKWEEDSDAARLIGEGLTEAQNLPRANKLLVRILVSDSEWPGTGRTINHLYNSEKAWNLDKSKIQLQLATYPYTALGVLHDKYLVVDDDVLVVTGANPERVHDDTASPWHDTGYLFTGAVARSALASFDNSWNKHARHWRCRERDLAYDCFDAHHVPPNRYWFSPTPHPMGTTGMIAVGRKASGLVNNNTENPQDLAWITSMDAASNNIHIETPNINDDAFQDAVVRAAARGTVVKLITSKGFNKGGENLPGQGGYNREVIGKLRQRMRREFPNMRRNLQICWYSQDGIRPIVGNGAGASHTKFFSVDGQVAIVGSGNMDTQSWNQSREFNVLLDSPQGVNAIEKAYFSRDWEHAICSLIELYEGNNGSQDLVCSVSAIQDQVMNLKNDDHCVHDEARSLILLNARKGRVIRLFDHPDGKREDDWLEIIVKRDITEKTIDTFEQTLEDADVRVIYHRNNGLDGKVSRLETSSSKIGPLVDLYEGNNATQNLLCSISIGQNRTVRFPNDSQCDNDEARSMVLYDVPAGRVLQLFDHPDGKKEDDWVEVVAKRNIVSKVIHTFETTFEDADVRMIYHRNNGLDGKVSRLRITASPVGPMVDLYEGNNATQNLVCSINLSQNRQINFQTDAQCDNDEARSLVMYDVPPGKALIFYDSPSGNKKDDWVMIKSKTRILRKKIATFESNVDDREATVRYFRNNGLDGKVSRLEIRNASGDEQAPPARVNWHRVITEPCSDLCAGSCSSTCPRGARCQNSPEGKACAPTGSRCWQVSGKRASIYRCQ